MSGARPDTWMPFYIGDYLADTMHLSRDQHGGYLLLIFAYWRRGGALPDDDNQLAAIAKATPAEWRKLRPVLAPFFQVGAGVWRHKRIDAELERAITKTEKRANAGAKGAATRWQNGSQNDGNAIAEPLANGSQNDAPSQSDSSLRSEKKEPPSGGSKKRATRLQDDFIVPHEWRGDAASARERNRLPPINLNLEAERFVNYWLSKGKDGAKTDWRKTWINWCLNARGSGERPAENGRAWL